MSRTIQPDGTTSRLRVRLLGGVELAFEGQEPCRFPTRKSELLFGYLALHRDRFCLRDTLAAALWRECSDATARKCLRTELWRVRSLVEPDRGSARRHLTVRRDGVRLASSPELWLDVEELEKLVLPATTRPGEATAAGDRQLQDAIGLYRGDFLAGHDEEWCLYARERYRALFLTALERLMDHWLAQGNPAAAVETGQRILDHDPLLERINRNMMLAYYHLGDRAAALRQYLRFSALLERELEVAPMEQTRSLFERIRNGRERPAAENVLTFPEAPPQQPEPARGIGQMVDELRATARALVQVAYRLERHLDDEPDDTGDEPTSRTAGGRSA